MQGYQHTLRRNSKPAVFLLLVIHCICSCASQAECVGATSRLFADTTRGCLQQTPSAAKEHPTQPTVQSSAQTVKQQAAAAGGASALIGSQGVSVRRHLLQSAHPSSANGRARLDHWSHNTTWAQKYANGSCFPSGRVLQAANIKGGPCQCRCRPACLLKLMYPVCCRLSHAALVSSRVCCHNRTVGWGPVKIGLPHQLLLTAASQV
jgi:hypothetical protein